MDRGFQNEGAIMIILLLSGLFPSWRWQFTQTLQYAQLEALFIDIPLMGWGAFMIIKSVGGYYGF